MPNIKKRHIVGGYKLLILDVQRYIYCEYGLCISSRISRLLADEIWKKIPEEDFEDYTIEYKQQRSGYSRLAPEIIWGISHIKDMLFQAVRTLKNTMDESLKLEEILR